MNSSRITKILDKLHGIQAVASEVTDAVKLKAHGILQIVREPDVSGRMYLITLVAALLVLVLVIRGPEQRGTFITDQDGNVTGIRRHSMTTSEQYDVELTIMDAAGIIEKEVSLTVRAVGGKHQSGAAPENSISHEAELSAEIDRMISDIELSDEEVIEFPDKLSNGTSILWREDPGGDRSEFYLIFAGYILLIIIVIRSRAAKPGDEGEKIRREIVRGLPRFCNQLFLMMNAGMILSDAFDMICRSYSDIPSSDRSWFENEMSGLPEESDEHRVSAASLINGFALRYNVKEMIRIAAILNENEKRGSDVIDNLSRESSYLWDERKIVAREYGKLIDTKMSLPLGMLLILLIVITMAPAMLSM